MADDVAMAPRSRTSPASRDDAAGGHRHHVATHPGDATARSPTTSLVDLDADRRAAALAPATCFGV